MSADPALAPERRADSSEAIDIISYSPSVPEEQRKTILSPLKWLALVLLALLLFALWFVFAARSVWVQIDPPADSLTIDGGMLRITWKDHYLMFPGEIEVSAQKEGYYPLQKVLTVSSEPVQKFTVELQKLPGKLRFIFADRVIDAVIYIGENAVLKDMNGIAEVAAGEYDLRIEAPRFQSWSGSVAVTGMGIAQDIPVDMKPDWADVTISTSPVNAEAWIGDTLLGTTPATFEILAGEHQLSLRARGYKRWFKTLNLAAEQQVELSDIKLAKADGSVAITTTPVAAAVAVDGQYKGLTPLTFKLPPGRSYTITASKVGFQRIAQKVAVTSDEDRVFDWQLVAQTGKVTLTGAPAGATVWADGQRLGAAGATFALPARDHVLEVRAAGYAPAQVSVLPRPAAPQRIAVSLLTLAQAREAELARKARIQTADGQTLLLMRPYSFTMGASRRVRGRRSNEQLREVKLRRFFYVATTEVSNRRFKAFDPRHSSGMYFSASLEADEHPVVNVSWDSAAQYCNWLSKQDGLPAAYVASGGHMRPVVPANTGYRLLTEAEWEWVARFSGARKATLFPWGESEIPPEEYGNFSDRSALGLTSAVIDNYLDGFPATAPVGHFAADEAGLFDMAGNVSEWTHDVYRASAFAASDEPTGTHVIRGSSWQHSRVSELRPTYRDSSDSGRADLGFRIGRYLE